METPQPLEARITLRDKDILIKHASGKRACIEFGCGGSTLEIAQAISGKLVSIESDRSWIEKLSQHPTLADFLSTGKVRLIHADIGETGQWGAPLQSADPRKWRNYYTRHWQAHGVDIDFAFIDGRFRVMCALSSLFFVSESAVVCIHDFMHRRAYYVSLKYFDVIEKGDEIIALRRRSDIDYRSLYFDIMDYQFDPS